MAGVFLFSAMIMLGDGGASFAQAQQTRRGYNSDTSENAVDESAQAPAPQYLPRPPRNVFNSQTTMRSGIRFGGEKRRSRSSRDVPDGRDVFTTPVEPYRRPGETVIDDEGKPKVVTANGELVNEEDLPLDSNGVDDYGIRRKPLQLSEPDTGRAQRVQPEPPVMGSATSSSSGGDDIPSINRTNSVRVNTRAEPIEIGTSRQLSEDPFAPTGRRWGTFDIFARLEQTIGYTNNAADAAGSDGGMEENTLGRLQMRSNWSQHQLNIEANGAYAKTFGDDGDKFPSASVLGDLRLDLYDDHTLNLRGRYDYTTEGSSSNNVPGDIDGRAGIHTYGIGAELEKTESRLGYQLEGKVDWQNYENADLIGGGTLDQGDRDLTLYDLRGRISYETAAQNRPFLEGQVQWREHDETRDRNGYKRDSFTYAIRGGLGFDQGEKFKGEIAVGYGRQSFDDNRLDDVDGLTIDGNIVWSPERDTTVTFTAATSLDASTSENDSGAAVYDGGILFERQINDRLSSSLNFGLRHKKYDGNLRDENTYTVGWGLDYWLSRYLGLTADINYERKNAQDDKNSYDSTTFQAGVILQN